MNNDGLSRWAARLARRTALSQPDLETILNLKGSVISYRARHEIVRVGERVSSVLVVRSGIVGQFAQSRAGTRGIVALHFAGEAANLPSYVLPDACCAQTAVTAVDLLAIPHHVIRELVRSSPAVFEALCRDICVDAAISEQWLLRNSRLDAAARLAQFLCEMVIRLQLVGSAKQEFSLPLTQADIADALGVTSVHISRILRDLRDRELADWSRGVARVLNWKELCTLGQFDPVYLHLSQSE